MVKNQQHFPLIPDDIPVLDVSPVMNLYEVDELITNIQVGQSVKEYAYTEITTPQSEIMMETTTRLGRHRTNQVSVSHPVPRKHQSIDRGMRSQQYSQKVADKPKNTTAERLSQSALSQKNVEVNKFSNKETVGGVVNKQSNEIRKAVKKDLQQKKSSIYPPKITEQISRVPGMKTNHQLEQREEKENLSRLAKNLHQESYILTEIKPEFQPPNNPSLKNKESKNSYDFLKKSQIYNPKNQKERKGAQEYKLPL